MLAHDDDVGDAGTYHPQRFQGAAKMLHPLITSAEVEAHLPDAADLNFVFEPPLFNKFDGFYAREERVSEEENDGLSEVEGADATLYEVREVRKVYEVLFSRATKPEAGFLDELRHLRRK